MVIASNLTLRIITTITDKKKNLALTFFMSKAQELALLRQTIYIPRGKVKYRYNPFPTSNKKQGN